MDIETLNARHAIDGAVGFVEGPGGLILARITHPDGEALVCTYGGQLLHFRPTDSAEDVFFVSSAAYFQPGKAIKGGVPVCWPWFGPDPEGRGRPAHGLVRTRQWQVDGSSVLDDGRISLTLGIEDDAETRAIWPFAFRLTVEFRVGEQLQIDLRTHNRGDTPFTVTQALHAYFVVGDIAQTKVDGLDGVTYIDKLDNGERKLQQGELTVDRALDRIYQGPPERLHIDDQQFERRLHIASAGSGSAVVWNPWVQGAAEMADLEPEDYRRMLCVETANAGDDRVTVPPGDSYRLSVRYRVQPD